MESTKEKSGILHQILPPRLEDAGLEDPALPPESIHQAFLQAAAAVKSRAASIFSSADDTEDEDDGCLNDPWPTAKEGSDVVVGIDMENEPPGTCIVDRGVEAGADEVRVAGGGGGDGADDLVVAGEGKLEEDAKACVDELHGLNIEDEKKDGEVREENDEENKKPTLVEGYA
ncbi:hypothetical protein LR48_Vigan406s017000 [Vigna angularis]|uniref:Uncharacterized protein n=2 Tax=Phaseolus angularis TaxID=3914 RepID=A0A0L9T9S0_PHAAN|nr:uncharacterized protein LOC108320616 [Vigna angularis]KAG2379827.1 uncharacterized protein HKW66_Vig0166060 [Vigna angularis]KOM27360.1 hypothetical protein LR48_Vigan406s017000 [Vigna angularis]BAT98509.1 hypothetical protein VIGAN_09216900 [Vigna angularis var. angularis]